MNIEEFRDYCLAKKYVTESFPFDEKTLVFKVANKMFALSGLEHQPATVNLKCNPERAIELREEYRTKAQDEIERYISIMKNIKLEGGQDQRLWDAINKNIGFETEQRDKYTKEINELWEMQSKEHLEFSQKCMDRFFEITSLLPDAVLSIREELNLEISNEAYLDIFNKNTEQGKRVFGEFIEKISKK